MAREVTRVCDICGNPTKQVVGKLYFTPMVPGVSRGLHSNYTHSADVGECCKARLLKSLRFSKRRSQQEYNHSRRVGAA